ncbi:hypothetical protein P43SY_010494 [Pythium insidiosum]|uniref:Uncharacterized protein n=1 Tax=Pythium insidiosum TaxID=114742 RepID=A0AAD5LYK4_PYTIN|nr:hypothetical protein P43SY_010494 [Pythium insidiosum]
MAKRATGWQRWLNTLATLGNALVLVAFFVLDVRDLYFKTVLLGPFDSFSFVAIGDVSIRAEPLVPRVVNVTAVRSASS